jgi:hypothetical protein
MGRLIHRTLTRWMAQQARCHRNRREEKERALPGIIMATQSFGDELRAHPHFHLLVSDGVFFPNGDRDFYAMGPWEQPQLLERIRLAVCRSLVARKLLQKETADTLLSWPLDQSGFSVFIGPSMSLPEESEDIRRVLRYILRSSFPLNRLNYNETTAAVSFRTTKGRFKLWKHAIDFLGDFSQHIPKPRQHTITYAGYFANALHKLSVAKTSPQEAPLGLESPTKNSRTRWAALILRTWKTDPELCPKCKKTMKRSKTLFDRVELNRLLKNLGVGPYPTRPRSPPPGDDPEEWTDPQGPAENQSQIPPGWEDWEAA